MTGPIIILSSSNYAVLKTRLSVKSRRHSQAIFYLPVNIFPALHGDALNMCVLKRHTEQATFLHVCIISSNIKISIISRGSTLDYRPRSAA